MKDSVYCNRCGLGFWSDRKCRCWNCFCFVNGQH